MAKRKRSVAAALWRGKAQGNAVPKLNEMLEAKCTGPFPGVRETQSFGKHEHDAEFVCTACGCSVAIVEVRAHPVLHVGICKHCYDFQVSDPFTRDNPQDPFWHENECRWCGDGGDVILCDSCPKVFCKYCIKRNFGEEILSVIESTPQKWSCFVCIHDHLQILIRDQMQATLIVGVLQTLIHDYSNVENLVKTMNRSGQPQKSRTSMSEGDSASTDEENNSNWSSLPSTLHHYLEEHKKAFTNDSREGEAMPLQDHLEHHPGFRKKLTTSHIRQSRRGLGSNSGQFSFPIKDFMRTHGERVQACVKFQGIHEDSPIHVITCRRSLNMWQSVHLLTSEWSKFVKDNGLEVGHELQFSLVADSSFVVRKV